MVGGNGSEVYSRREHPSTASFFFCCPAGQFRPPKQACLKTLSFLRLSPQSHHAIFNGDEIREELAEGDQFTIYFATGGVVTNDS
jgi:hypothetical protein